MDRNDVREAARLLIATHGDRGAISYATAQAVEAHMRGDETSRTRWQAVSAELRFLIRPPQTSMRDVYRAAWAMLNAHGEAEALRLLAERAHTVGPTHAGLYPLLRGAVVDLARREPGWEELVQ